MYGIGVHGPLPRPNPIDTAAGPIASPPRPAGPGPPAGATPPGPPVAPGFSDTGASTVLELQNPRLPPIHTPFTVLVLPSTMCPSASRGAGWLAGRLPRAGACAPMDSVPAASA